MSKNVPFWSVLAHIFETSGWNNITFGCQGDIGIIHSSSDFDHGMTSCDLELFLGGWASTGRPFSFKLKTLGEKVGYYHIACPQIFYYLGLAIVFIDECNPSKLFKMASNSFEVTDVPF